LNPLPLILKYRVIEYLVYIEEKVEIVEADNRFLFRCSTEAILVDK